MNLKKTRHWFDYIVSLICIIALIILLVFGIYITNTIISKNQYESKLITVFTNKYGGIPEIIETESKHNLINYANRKYRGFDAYYLTLKYQNKKYHAYIEKTLDWDISEIK